MTKKWTKKHDARAKLLFYQSKPIAFVPFSFMLPLSLLKLPLENVMPINWHFYKYTPHPHPHL